MTDKAACPIPFDPEDAGTWPIPRDAVLTRWPDGRPRRLDTYGDGWIDGFDRALEMANHFHQHGEWPSTSVITDGPG